MKVQVIAFDLDDTLFKEIDFLKSGYRQVSEFVAARFGLDAGAVRENLMGWYVNGLNPFARLNEKYGIDTPVEEYLDIYRFHEPEIELEASVIDALSTLKTGGCLLGIVSDGRLRTQMNKIRALGLPEWIEEKYVVVNQTREHFKPAPDGFEILAKLITDDIGTVDSEFTYVGDNTEKDFIRPNMMGWKTVCLRDDGRNIHSQDFNLSWPASPQSVIDSMTDLIYMKI